MMLENRNILLGVSASVSIYKAIELLRLFKKAGANVKVVMTPSAKKFVSPLTFEAAGSQKVLCEENEDWTNRNNHIHVTEDYELFVIAPATANTINKLSNGIADNLLTQTALAFDGPKIIAPAMNTKMYNNQFTQASFKLLRLNGYTIIEPQSKELACGTEGVGALADIHDIFYESARALLKDPFWEDRYAIVTGGGTKERIDDVRSITNESSGKQACALAKALYIKGAKVELISTKPCDESPKGIDLFECETAQEMYELLQERIKVAKRGIVKKPDLINDLTQPRLITKKPYLFMAAAVSDYRPKFAQRGKLKKEQLGKEWCLELVENIDILQSIDKEGIITIGFKAETDEKTALENAKKMLVTKGLDAVCLNIVKNKTAFGSDLNQIVFITEDKAIQSPVKTKLELSLDIATLAKVLDE